MIYLLEYDEFLEAKTSNYKPPTSAIKPASGDKIWHYMKDELKKGPMWGISAKRQEKTNQRKRT